MRHLALTRCMMVLALLILSGCGGSSTSDSTAPGSGESGSGLFGLRKAPPPPIVVAAGTVIPVTIDQSVSTENNNVGDSFAASLAAPVTIDGKVVIPQGAKASGHVAAAEQAGRVQGSARLVLNLDSVTVNGQTMQIHTRGVVEAGEGRGQRTAIGAGAGAAAGAIVGAIAGGGRGAAIGAGAGAGAGTAGAVLTGNRDITIAAETRFDFSLTEPLEIPAR